MMMVNKNKLRQIKNLYERGSSVSSIAKQMKVTLDSMFYFFRKHNIKRRSASETNNIRFTNRAPSFNVKKYLSNEEEKLKIAGIMLYWGEGSQWSGETIVDFANSNPVMIKVFLNFLRKICGIDEKKMKVYLYCYGNQDIYKLINYWRKVTGINKSQFTKPYVRSDYRSDKSGKMQYGLIHIRYYDKKLLLTIKKWINEYIEN